MIRLALILSLLAAPVLAQVVPVPRPEGLVERALDTALAETVQSAVSEDLGQALPDIAALDRAVIAEQIARSIRACWNVSNLSEEAQAVRIWVAFNTTPEGEIIRESIEMTQFESGTQDAADEALGPAFRAIMRCAEMGLDLPPRTHPIWQRIELGFDASSVAF